MTEPRTLTCAYGPCPVEFVPTKPWQRFHDSACRRAEWRRTHAPAGVMRPHASHSTAPAKITAPSGVQSPYGRVLALVRSLVADPQEAEEKALSTLPARQRARLLERGGS